MDMSVADDRPLLKRLFSGEAFTAGAFGPIGRRPPPRSELGPQTAWGFSPASRQSESLLRGSGSNVRIAPKPDIAQTESSLKCEALNARFLVVSQWQVMAHRCL